MTYWVIAVYVLDRPDFKYFAADALRGIARVFRICFIGYFGFAGIRWLLTNIDTRRYERPANWNSVQGKVITTRFRRISNWVEISSSYCAEGERQGLCRVQEHGVRMRGRYQVDPESARQHDADVKKDLGTYAKDDSVTVKYTPSRPDESVLWYGLPAVVLIRPRVAGHSRT